MSEIVQRNADLERDMARDGRSGETAVHWENVQAARLKVRNLTDKARELVQHELEDL
jgi:hypothetical protein